MRPVSTSSLVASRSPRTTAALRSPVKAIRERRPRESSVSPCQARAPKVGTVTMDVAQAVAGAKGGSVEFRVEKAGIVQAGVGKASFTEQALVENICALVEAVMKAKPSGSKGTFMKRIAVTSTMGPGVKIEPTSVAAGVH